jgi:hypothetical protein
VEPSRAMYRLLRPFAPTVLLLTSMSGFAATAAVVAHMARDHAVALEHQRLHEEPGHAHDDDEHGDGHSHALAEAPFGVPARTAAPSAIGLACLPVAERSLLDAPVLRGTSLGTPPGLGATPLLVQRSPVLLI